MTSLNAGASIVIAGDGQRIVINTAILSQADPQLSILISGRPVRVDVAQIDIIYVCKKLHITASRDADFAMTCSVSLSDVNIRTIRGIMYDFARTINDACIVYDDDSITITLNGTRIKLANIDILEPGLRGFLNMESPIKIGDSVYAIRSGVLKETNVDRDHSIPLSRSAAEYLQYVVSLHAGRLYTTGSVESAPVVGAAYGCTYDRRNQFCRLL